MRWVISPTLLNSISPLAISKQIPAHRPPPINYGPSAFHFYHSCITHEKHRNHKSKSHLHHHFGLKSQPLNPILPRDLKGVPGNGANPLLKYLAPPPFLFIYFILVILFNLDLLWLCYVRINPYLDFNSWPLTDPMSRRPKETQINVTGQPSCVVGSTLDERKNPPYYFSPHISSVFIEERCYDRYRSWRSWSIDFEGSRNPHFRCKH